MTENGTLDTFMQHLAAAISSGTLIKLAVGNKRDKSTTLQKATIKPVVLKQGQQYSFLYRYPTNDITKNHVAANATSLVQELLQSEFLNADLFTTEADYHLLLQPNAKGKLVKRKPSQQLSNEMLQHDKTKHRLIAPAKPYLHALGLTTADGQVKKDMQDKYKQINHYVEIIDGIIQHQSFQKSIHVVDMGCGKGYLTFALYDYLVNTKQLQASMTGIEMRPDLVQLCNAIAANAGFNQLQFSTGTIADTTLPATDILIALHACDTATDDAIYKGIAAGASIIVCAPCCHKQIRKQMKPDNILQQITKHGILLERQAEMVTDSIRAMLMEAHGYKTKVFDFIGTEHTPKNLMIAGVKSNVSEEKKTFILQQVQELKKLFNIHTHYLETLLAG